MEGICFRAVDMVFPLFASFNDKSLGFSEKVRLDQDENFL